MSLDARVRRYSRKLLAKLGLGLTTAANLERLERHLRLAEDINFLLHLSDEKIGKCLRSLASSKSQLRQDLFVLSEMDFKREGYFVEFGATNGIELSNTFILEKDFAWKGILAEPARCWHSSLKVNRSCSIDTRCVWKNSNSTVTFNETQDAKLSTVEVYSGSDIHKKSRRGGKQYEVATISLVDLLDLHDAPKVIDYLSIDTEGSEFDILDSFPFDKYEFRTITCEHNYTPQRGRIFDLLSRHGYHRKFQDLSGMDDWYVRS